MVYTNDRMNFIKNNISHVTFIIFVAVHGLLYQNLLIAFGISVLLLIHEWGHLREIKKYNIPHSPPIFIPFMGAVIGMTDVIDEKVEMNIAIGGPLIGTLAAVIVGALGIIFSSTELVMISLVGILINLINTLVTVSPFDGGRIMNRILPLSKVSGLLITFVLVWVHTIFVLFAIVSIHSLGKKLPTTTLSVKERFTWIFAWFALVLVQFISFVLIVKGRLIIQ